MTVRILRHIENNTLGKLEAVLQKRGLTFEYLEAKPVFEPMQVLDGATGLVILGGHESASQDDRHAFMPQEQQLIREAIKNDLPLFGICLGSQMIARALGAPVERNMVNGEPFKETGWVPLELTAAGKSDPVMSKLEGTAQFQWHEDTFHWPPGAVPLAASATCARQAYYLKDHPRTYAVQFHPEVTLDVIAQWLKESTNTPETRKQAIWEESEKNYQERHRASARMFDAFCELAF